MISKAKKGDRVSMKRISKYWGTQQTKDKIMNELVPRYKFRHSGYTRVLKIGYRARDAAHMSLIEFVDRPDELRPARPVTAQHMLNSLKLTSQSYKEWVDRRPYLRQSDKLRAYRIQVLEELVAKDKAEAENAEKNENNPEQAE